MDFSDDMIQSVWEKGIIVKGYNPDVLRKDHWGAWIIKNHYGTCKSEYSWEVDHISPQSDGGTDDISNLRPLQWENKTFRQGTQFIGTVTSHFVNNIRVK